MVEIMLGPELLSTLCRRSRRRLRDIQANCQVAMKLDRTRCVLRIFGPEACIEAAQKQLSSLGGPRKTVPAAVWAELMRTRTLQSSKQAIVLLIQELSGCRIHIERSRHEVRIFGPQDGIVVAEKLLEELEKRCAQKVLPAHDPASLDVDVLQKISEELGVAVQLEEAEVVVMGLADRVPIAVREISKYMEDSEFYQLQLSSQDHKELAAAWPTFTAADLEALASHSKGRGFGSASSSSSDIAPMPGVAPRAPAVQPQPQPQPPSMRDHRQGQMPRVPPYVRSPPPTSGGWRMNQQACHHDAPEPCICPTCGVGRFCHYCGQQTWVYVFGSGSSRDSESNCGGMGRFDQLSDGGSVRSGYEACTRAPAPAPPPHTHAEDEHVGGMWIGMPAATGPAHMSAAEAAGEALPARSSFSASHHMVGMSPGGVIMGGMVPMCFPIGMAPDQTAQMPWVGNVPMVAQGYPDAGVNGNQMTRHIYMVPAYSPPTDDHQLPYC
uniref:Uncharacterized protein n=1 Tax=Alexandrium catenella TaxID=2925 RepID=A0A7S1W2J9_ALECA